jgi:aquaporin Z
MYSETTDLWKALLVEFLGTFTLVFVGVSAASVALASGGSLLAIALAFGLALLAIIYIWGSYSGAHVNPAVSFGFAVAGQMNWGLMLGYWIAQILGAIAGAALVAYFFGIANGAAGGSLGSLTTSDAWRAVFATAVVTFFLVLAYLFVYRNPMQSLVAGIVIGAVLAVTILATGFLTGGSSNPALSLGTAIFTSNLGTIWIFIVGPLVGALIAALVYKLFTTDFNCCYKVDECKRRVTDECGNCIKICKRPCLDRCGKPIVDECGKQKYEEYEVIERSHGYMQEHYHREMEAWLAQHKVEYKGNCAPCGLPPVITEKTVIVTNPVLPTQAPILGTPVVPAPVLTPVMSAPVVNPVMTTATSQGPVEVTPVASTVTPVTTSNEIRSTRAVSPNGFRTPITPTPYTVPRL